MTDPLRLYVGYDPREDIAYEVCRETAIAHASRPLEVTALKQSELRARGLYTRPVDPLSTTEFTFTRFLVPALQGFSGWAVFCDCDFLWMGDIAELFAKADPAFAVLCVQHDYRPTETTKMDGQVQTLYPRKNWSSMMLWNCAHPSNRVLTPDLVSRETGAFLHRFQWLDDAEIGAVGEEWNWLEGWYPKQPDSRPKAVHFTRGGPWFENWRDVDYGPEWLEARDRLEGRRAVA
jgi:hypothetical protein